MTDGDLSPAGMLPLAAMTLPKPFVVPPLLVLFLASLAFPLGAEGIKFREVSRDWGIDFRHHFGGSGRRYIVETVAGGVVMFVFDGRGDPGLLFVRRGSLPRFNCEPAHSRLFRHDRK